MADVCLGLWHFTFYFNSYIIEYSFFNVQNIEVESVATAVVHWTCIDDVCALCAHHVQCELWRTSLFRSIYRNSLECDEQLIEQTQRESG